MKKASKIVPGDLHAFLSANEGKQFTYQLGPELPSIEVDTFKFHAPSDLKLSTFEIDTHEYHLNHKEPGDDPGLRFDIEGVDLLCECKNHTPDGILVYFPEFQEYGCWDCDHLLITMYPEISWCKIEKRLPEYVNAQWYPELAKHYLLRPWADDRCSRIKTRPSN